MNNDIREYDVVALTENVPEHNLVRGQVGTVVMDYSPDAAEVEFVDPNGATYALLTLRKAQLMRLHHTQAGAA